MAQPPHGDDEATREQPAVDPDRTWHTPVPPTLGFRPAHEQDWPPVPGQPQWHPEPDPAHAGHPQHALPPPDDRSAPHAPPQTPYEVPLSPPAERRRLSALWLSVALTFTLLLCGGGAFSAFLVLRNAEDGGAPDPTTAVTRFLNAVYAEQDAKAADDHVCREARDAKQIAAKVDEIKGYARDYDQPRFRWDEPAVATEDEDRATVSVALTMTTADEKTAEQQLAFTVVKKGGWWVCEVSG